MSLHLSVRVFLYLCPLKTIDKVTMRSFILNLNIVCLLAVCFFACGSRHSSNLLLHQVDSLLEVRPDSALAVLQNIASTKKMTEQDRAYYALLMAAAIDKNEFPLLPCDSLLDFALDYYDDDDKEMAVALLYKGRLLAQMDDEKAAIENSLKALEVLQDYPEDTKYRRLIYSTLGLWYGDCGLYDKALEVLNQSFLYSFNAKDTSIAYNNIGRVYAMRDLTDSAIVYQRRSVKYAELSGDAEMVIVSWHGLSLYYGRLEEVDSAMVYARKVIQHLSDKCKDWGSYLYNMGDLYVDLEQYDSARYYLERSLLFSQSKVMSYWSLAILEAQLGNFQSAYQYLDASVTIQDSLDAKEELTEIQHLVYKHQTELEVKDEQIKSRNRIGWIILVTFIIVLFYQYLLYRRNKRQALYRQSLQHANDRLLTMQQRIEENESMIVVLRDNENKNLDEIGKREQLITQLKQEKFALRTWLFQQAPIYKKVIMLSEQKVSHKKELKVMSTAEHGELQKTVLGIYAEYVSSLRAQYRLTDDDLLFLCLEKADIPALTIALCFGHSDTSAINQRRSRLKTKMS